MYHTDVPELSTDADYHKAVFGHSYTINCKVDATPFHKHVYWEHRTKGLTRKLKNDTVGVSGVSLENPSLTISFVTTSDTGSYTCFAENIIGTGFSRTVQLEVKGGMLFYFINIYGNTCTPIIAPSNSHFTCFNNSFLFSVY